MRHIIYIICAIFCFFSMVQCTETKVEENNLESQYNLSQKSTLDHNLKEYIAWKYISAYVYSYVQESQNYECFWEFGQLSPFCVGEFTINHTDYVYNADTLESRNFIKCANMYRLVMDADIANLYTGRDIISELTKCLDSISENSIFQTRIRNINVDLEPLINEFYEKENQSIDKKESGLAFEISDYIIMALLIIIIASSIYLCIKLRKFQYLQKNFSALQDDVNEIPFKVVNKMRQILDNTTFKKTTINKIPESKPSSLDQKNNNGNKIIDNSIVNVQYPDQIEKYAQAYRQNTLKECDKRDSHYKFILLNVNDHFAEFEFVGDGEYAILHKQSVMDPFCDVKEKMHDAKRIVMVQRGKVKFVRENIWEVVNKAVVNLEK